MSIEARFKVQRDGFTLDVALSLLGQGVSAVFGPSGCGKTTLLRAIAGLDKHPGSHMRAGDQVWQDAQQFVPTHKRALGYVFQEPGLFAHLTVQGNLDYGVKRNGSRQAGQDNRTSLQKAIALLDIGHLLHRRPVTLSAGEKQRVAIARALAAGPRLLLMDEPLAALDQARKNQLLPYIAALHEALNIPVIYVSHSRAEVARLANHLVLLDAGRVIAQGPTAEILTRLDLPLAHGDEAAAMFETRVSGHDKHYNLTHLGFAGGEFTVIGNDLPVGSIVRLQVAARDVSLTLAAQTGSSILNSFPATIETVTPEGDALVTVRLDLAGLPLLARVTRKSADTLKLKPGLQVFAQAKSVALLP